MTNPWSAYWQESHLHSCIASKYSQDSIDIENLWRKLINEQPTNLNVLDLATGNGSVPLMLLKVRNDLDIIAVDKSDIKPLESGLFDQYLSKVNFIANIDIIDLPFADGSFDIVTSQYGIEYANLSDVAIEVTRVLVEKGVFQFLIHAENSSILKANIPKLDEMKQLLSSAGVINFFEGYLAGNVSLYNLEMVGEQYLKQDTNKTQSISGNIFDSIGRITQDADKNRAHTMGNELIVKLNLSMQRLEQMKNAALNEDDIKSFCDEFSNLSMSVKKPVLFQVGTHDNKANIGWLLKGFKL